MMYVILWFVDFSMAMPRDVRDDKESAFRSVAVYFERHPGEDKACHNHRPFC